LCSVYINTLFHDWWLEGATSSICLGHGCALDCTKMNKGQNVLPWKLGTKHFECLQLLYNSLINFYYMFYSYVQEANFDI